MNRPRAQGERGFTLVEIVVAMFIIMIAVVAAAATLHSTSKAQGHTKILDRQRAAVSAVLARATADSTWIARNNCPKTGECIVPASDPIIKESTPVESDGTVTHQLALVAEGVDLPTDGVGTIGALKDRDGVIPDIYRLRVTNTITVLGESTQPPKYVATSTLDMSQRGSTGTIEIQACKIEDQVDERIGTGLCNTPTPAQYDIAGPGTCVATSFDCIGWIDARTDDPDQYAKVKVSPFGGIQFTLEGPLAEGPTTRSVAVDAQGLGRVEDLRPGQYRLKAVASSIGNFSNWETHSTPTGGYVTVSAGELRHAVQLFHPKRTGDVMLEIASVDKTDPGNIVRTNSAIVASSVKLMPIPSNRDIPERGGSTLGWTVVRRGDSSVKLVAGPDGIRPGLYAGRMVAYPGDSTVPLELTKSYVWIDSGSSTTVLKMVQEFCDVDKRRAIVIATCPTYQRFCFSSNGTFYGGCRQDPSGGQDSIGAGGA